MVAPTPVPDGRPMPQAEPPTGAAHTAAQPESRFRLAREQRVPVDPGQDWPPCDRPLRREAQTGAAPAGEDDGVPRREVAKDLLLPGGVFRPGQQLVVRAERELPLVGVAGDIDAHNAVV